MGEEKKPHRTKAQAVAAVPFLVELWHSKELRGLIAALFGIKVVKDELCKNSDYWADFIKFNFFNSKPCTKVYPRICPGDPPPVESKKIQKIYETLINYTYRQIYQMLCIQQTETNRNMPLETKWVFEYLKKYGTWDYHPNNTISEQEILRPLNYSELQVYLKMF